MPSAAPKSQDLKELAECFPVCREFWSEYTFIKHKKRQIVFGLGLSGSPKGPEEHLNPDARSALKLFRHLTPAPRTTLQSGVSPMGWHGLRA
jgi:hypothetical protein